MVVATTTRAGSWTTDSGSERRSNMFNKAFAFAVIGSAFAFGCAQDPADETQEIIDNLVQAGFPTDDIQVFDGKVYTGLDAVVSLEGSREMLQTGPTTDEQYR